MVEKGTFLIQPMNKISSNTLASKPIFCQDDFDFQILFFILSMLIDSFGIKRLDRETTRKSDRFSNRYELI